MEKMENSMTNIFGKRENILCRSILKITYVVRCRKLFQFQSSQLSCLCGNNLIEKRNPWPECRINFFVDWVIMSQNIKFRPLFFIPFIFMTTLQLNLIALYMYYFPRHQFSSVQFFFPYMTTIQPLLHFFLNEISGLLCHNIKTVSTLHLCCLYVPRVDVVWYVLCVSYRTTTRKG